MFIVYNYVQSAGTCRAISGWGVNKKNRGTLPFGGAFSKTIFLKAKMFQKNVSVKVFSNHYFAIMGS
jgi:hypothetical protein